MMLTDQLPGRTSAYETSDVRPQVNGLVEARRRSASSLRWILLIIRALREKLQSPSQRLWVNAGFCVALLLSFFHVGLQAACP